MSFFLRDHWRWFGIDRNWQELTICANIWTPLARMLITDSSLRGQGPVKSEHPSPDSCIRQAGLTIDGLDDYINGEKVA